MSPTSILIIVLLLLAFGAMVSLLFVLNGKSKAKQEEVLPEVQTLRAMGVRCLASSSSSDDRDESESRKRLLVAQSSKIPSDSVPKIRQKTQEFSMIADSAEAAVNEVLAKIANLAFDIKDRLYYFESIPATVLYSTSKNLASNILLAQRLFNGLNTRASLVRAEFKSANPDFKKAYEIGTDRLALANDSVNSLISSADLEPIRWTDLNSTITDLLRKLDFARTEILKKNFSKGKQVGQ